MNSRQDPSGSSSMAKLELIARGESGFGSRVPVSSALSGAGTRRCDPPPPFRYLDLERDRAIGPSKHFLNYLLTVSLPHARIDLADGARTPTHEPSS